MRQLSATDALFLQLEKPHVPFHIGILEIYQPLEGRAAPSLEEVLAELRTRLHLSGSFREKLVTARFGLDFPYWIEDPAFDLEYHVRHVALPKPGNWRQLMIQVARLHSRPLDLGRPLWELYVIEGLDNIEGLPPGSFAIMTKIHHAAVDGVSLLEITSAVHDTSPDAPPPSPAQPWRPEPEPTTTELLARAAYNNATRPWRFAQLMSRTSPGGDRLATRPPPIGGDTPSGPAPRTRFSGVLSGHKVIEARRFEFATA